MTQDQSPQVDEAVVARVAIVLAASAALVYAAVAWPVLAWSTAKGQPTLMPLWRALHGGVEWLRSGFQGSPRSVDEWRYLADLLPSKTGWVLLEILGVAVAGIVGFAIWSRVDRWRSRRWVGLRPTDLRGKTKPRAWATPRDFSRLRPGWRGKLMRVARGERPLVASAGHDGWPLGRVRGRRIRSGPEMHVTVVAPTRSGKSSRVVIPAAVEHHGPAVVLSNKTDVVTHTLAAREQHGPVHMFAPMTDAGSLPGAPTGWTPLQGCADWETALRMGQWLFDADPRSAAEADGSSGARFYNREALAGLLPALLHAAALEDRSMADVLRWLKSDVDGLDEPRRILQRVEAHDAATLLAGVQALDERPRSYLLPSASQLIDGYRFPSVRRADRQDFDPSSLLQGGTLYLIAPESDQDTLAPIFGGLLGAILRVWEREAASGASPPLLKILADEAAHLAPLAKLPTYLAVSGGWGVRWCIVYQSLAQLRHRYGDEADAVLGNTLIKLFLGPIQDEATRRYVVDLLDQETVTTTSRSSQRPGGPESKTRHERPTPKVSAQGLMQLPEGEAILVHGRDLPAVTYLPAWWETRRRRR